MALLESAVSARICCVVLEITSVVQVEPAPAWCCLIKFDLTLLFVFGETGLSGAPIQMLIQIKFVVRLCIV